jgi:type VI secretion system protein ImpH
MANSNRLSQRYLSDLNLHKEELYSQSFAGLLRFLNANSPQHEPLGYSVSLKQDAFRLGQAPIMHFHASAFAEVIEQSTLGQYKLNNVSWGLFGVNGPLPLHFTEYAIERKYRHQDVTLSEFCDIFHHRFLSLFYRSWADAQPTVSHDRPEKDVFAKRLAVFAGFDNNQSPAADKTNTIHKFLAGLYSMKNRSAGALGQILSEYLQHKVMINEFEGVWYPLPKEAHCRLSSMNSSLGNDTIIGNSTFQRSFNFSIIIGPLHYQEYMALINNKQSLQMIKQLTTRHVGSEFSFTIKLQLASNQTKAIPLGLSCLGINSWLAPDSNNSQNSDTASIAYQYAC